MDNLYHFALIFIVCLLLGKKIAITVGLTIELTQMEAFFFSHNYSLSGYYWMDTGLDLIADAVGLAVAILLIRALKWKRSSTSG